MMCNCFKELERKAIKQAKIDYPNSQLVRIDIERTFGKVDKARGYISMDYAFKGKKGIYRRNAINVDTNWKFCPLCGGRLNE